MARRDTLLALAVALAAFAVHQGVLANGFVRLDDSAYVAGNRMVQQGLSAEGVQWAFSSWWMSNYHPLTWLSHMADVEALASHALAAGAVMWAIALALLAVDQVRAWRDTETLFVRSLVAAPGAFVLHRNLGNEYWAQQRIEEAVEQYRRAVAIAPTWAPARESLIAALLETGDLPAAVGALRELLAQRPDAHSERTRLAHVLRVSGALDEAIVEYRRVADALPDSAAPKRNLGSALLEAQRPG